MPKEKRWMVALVMVTLLFGACQQSTTEQDKLLCEGVSWELAVHRQSTITDLRYDITFHIPLQKDAPVEGQETITFCLSESEDVILDFREEADHIHQVSVAGTPVDYQVRSEHIVIPATYMHAGENSIALTFTAGSQSLNRRDGYVYTLFVPDRARTVFPCFEQPNLKGRFTLSLDIPEGWVAVSNTSQQDQQVREGRKHIRFGQTEPLPTYLFAFAAGEFQYQSYEENGRTIGAYYRETDERRIAQLPDIFQQVMFALRWQEDFTGVPYPFAKYDLVILPGFQFGGMEHTGATFYNDNTLFLSENPTPDELLHRTELISHETSHMWFGDAVTMEWFNDVWTKEVFANYFAAEITEPLFPDLNHRLNWLRTYQGAAISQDRTDGRTSIRQPLDNMRNAGLIYNSIIYNKAPVMMRKMVQLMGKEAFRRGIQKYVRTYLYGNATWDDLITILDAETDADLRAFSRDWVDTANWPHFTARAWDDERISQEYGIHQLSCAQADSLMQGGWQGVQDKVHRQALLMNLYENYLARMGGISDTGMMRFLIDNLQVETDPLTASTLISYMGEPLQRAAAGHESFDQELWQLAHRHTMPQVRTGLLRLLASKVQSPQVVDSLYALWQTQGSALLSENDYVSLAYELAIRQPHRALDILALQRSRLTNPDRLQQFDFVSRALTPDAQACDTLFASLQQPQNRRIEPWALQLLYYLNHPLREQQSVKYIRPALQLLPEIQRTGDIFFPGNWCNNLLAGHRSPEAYRQVEQFLQENQDMQPLLRNKILSAEHFLKQNNMNINEKKQ